MARRLAKAEEALVVVLLGVAHARSAGAYNAVGRTARPSTALSSGEDMSDAPKQPFTVELDPQGGNHRVFRICGDGSKETVAKDIRDPVFCQFLTWASSHPEEAVPFGVGPPATYC